MKKSMLIFLMISLCGLASHGKFSFGSASITVPLCPGQPGHYVVSFLGQQIVIKGQVKQDADFFTIYNVRVQVSQSSPLYYLGVDIGYGSQPLDELCSALTGGLYPHANSYGHVDTRPMALVHSPRILIIEQENGLATGFRTEIYEAGVHYRNLQCSKRLLDY